MEQELSLPCPPHRGSRGSAWSMLLMAASGQGREGPEPMAVKTRIAHPSVEERQAHGKEARDQTPPSSHTGWTPAADRPDPVALLEEQNRTREPDLVPVRHGRMLVSPFTFYRGAAKIMAADLKDTPRAGLRSQLCGDAHLSNFGALRLTGAAAAVRSQRLRRDPARPVRVRRQAHGGELHHRRPQQRLHQGRHAGGDPGRRWAPTARRWPSFAADGHHGHLVCPSVRG